MDSEIIVKCGICGRKILYQGLRSVSSESNSALLFEKDIHQDGAMFWHDGEVYSTRQSESDVNAFLEEELVHKITSIAELSVRYYTCGHGCVKIAGKEEIFEFGGDSTLVDAMARALLYLVTI